MRRICIDARMIRSSGIGTYLRNILPYIIEKYAPEIILAPEDSSSFSWIPKELLIKSDHSIYSIKEQFFFSRAIRHDLFWSPHFNVPLFPVKVKKRIVTIHDVFHLAFFDTLKWKEKAYAKIVYKQAVKKSEVIITDSRFSKSEIIKYLKVPSDKIYVINCAVNFNCFQLSRLEDVDIFQKYNIKKPFFLFVGNLKPHKNLKVLIEAYDLLKDSFDLVIIGKSNGLFNSDSIISSVKSKKNIHFLSDITNEELPLFYKNARSFIFPSFYEGFGLPILESMAMGCPVIGSTSASIPEVGEDAIIYFDSKNYFELAAQMRRIAFDQNLRRRLIDQGFEQVKKFSWEKAARSHIELFEALLK